MFFRIVKAVVFFAGFIRLYATTITVNLGGDTSPSNGGVYGANIDLRGALNYVNSHPLDTYDIMFDPAFPLILTLAAPLPPINFPIAGQDFTNSNVTLDGSIAAGRVIVNGANAFRPFYAHTGHITLRNLVILDGHAIGGAGGVGAGGGGAGLGGALFVNSTAFVSVENVEFTGCSVTGGAGGVASVAMGSSGGGGGGLGGNGGNGGTGGTSSEIAGAGGGGGFSPTATGGVGGNAVAPGGSGGSGGGGGCSASGGIGGLGGAANSGGGGGGGGYGGSNAAGGNGATGITSGTAGGSGGQIPNLLGISLGGGGGGGGNFFANAGDGGSGTGMDQCTVMAMTGFGGAGGGVTNCMGVFACDCTDGMNLLAGNGGGGGGGGGGAGRLGSLGVAGGQGGVGGGGGGATGLTSGGLGSHGGGGGGGGGASNGLGGGGGAFAFGTINGGAGGFGGGGGGCGAVGTHTSGNGGFGGGAGGLNGNAMATNGTSGVGGGNPSATAVTSGGGGGAALGCAIFVNTGGSLTYLTDGLSNGTTTSAAFTTTPTPPNTSGAGFTGATSGNAVQEIFAMSGNTLSFEAAGSSDVLTISAGIADDTVQSLTPPANFRLPNAANPGISLLINPTGLGTVSLAGQSTYGGDGSTTFTQIFSGTLRIGFDSSLGASAVPLIFGGSSTLHVPNTIASSSRQISVNAGITGTMQIDTEMTHSGFILMGSASSNLTKTGAGTLTLNGSNNSAGSYTVDTGILVLGGVNTYTGITTVNNAATLQSSATNSFSSSSSHVLNNSSVMNLNNTNQTIGSLASSSASTTVQLGAGTLSTGLNNQTTTFMGQITGTGGVICVGNSVLTLSGNTSYTGPTSIQSGTLIVNGTLQSPVTVASGATLKGTGSIQASTIVQSGGTIHGGNSIGTITLGTLTLQPGANMQLELAPEQNNNTLYTVTGDVNLGGSTLNISLVQPISSYPPNQTYVFITSQTSITGTFAIVNAPTGFVAHVDYSNPQATVLNHVSVPHIGSKAHLSHNERVLLNYLSTLTHVRALHPLFVDLSLLSPDQLPTALDSISPARNAAMTYFANHVFFSVGDISVHRLREGRQLGYGAGSREKRGKEFMAAMQDAKMEALVAMNEEAPVSSMPADFEQTAIAAGIQKRRYKPRGSSKSVAAKRANYGFWAAGFGELLRGQEQHKNPVIHDTAAGAVVGLDYYGYQNGFFTVSAAYIHNDIDEKNSAGGGSSNGFSVAGYGTGTIGNGYIEGGFMFGWSRFHLHRHITFPGPFPFKDTASSSFGNWQLMPHFGGGYDWINEYCVVEPFAAVDWALSIQGAYREKGASPLNMHVKSQTPSILRTQIGVNIYETWEKNCHLMIFEQTMSYVNKAPLNTHVRSSLIVGPGSLPSGTPGSFTVLTYNRVLSLAGVGFEIFYKHKPSGFFTALTYQGEFGTSFMSNDVTGTLGVFF